MNFSLKLKGRNVNKLVEILTNANLSYKQYKTELIITAKTDEDIVTFLQLKF